MSFWRLRLPKINEATKEKPGSRDCALTTCNRLYARLLFMQAKRTARESLENSNMTATIRLKSKWSASCSLMNKVKCYMLIDPLACMKLEPTYRSWTEKECELPLMYTCLPLFHSKSGISLRRETMRKRALPTRKDMAETSTSRRTESSFKFHLWQRIKSTSRHQ